MTADQALTSRLLDATHCLDVSFLADEQRESRPALRPPTASHARVRAVSGRPAGAKWVEAARTELGVLAALDERSWAPGFAAPGPQSRSVGTAETAFMLVMGENERETIEDDRPASLFAGPAALPQSPIVGQTDSTAPSTPGRPSRAIDASSVRAVLSQPAAALLPSPDHSASEPPFERMQAIALAQPAPKPRAKSFAPPKRARARSFAGQLGVPVAPPSAPTAPVGATPVGTANRMVVVTHASRSRTVNMAAAILSGLAAAMAVMAVIVSV